MTTLVRLLSAVVFVLRGACGRARARAAGGSGAPAGGFAQQVDRASGVSFMSAGLLTAGMATVRAVRVLVAGAATVASVLAFSGAPAHAAYQHAFISQLSLPAGSAAYSVAVDDQSGDTLVAASGPDVVDLYDSSGSLVTTWTGGTCQSGSAAGSAGSTVCSTPAGSFGGGQVSVAANNTTGNAYVSDSSDAVVDILSSTGAYLGQLTGVTFANPRGVAVDQATGKIYVADQGAGVVDVFNSSGAFTGTLTGRSLSRPVSVAVDDHSGTVLVAEGFGSDAVDVFGAATGAYQATWNGSAATNPPGAPAGSFGTDNVQVGVDGATGQVYVGDSGDGVVDELDSSGNYLGQLTGAPGGAFQTGAVVLGVGVGQASGDLYEADSAQDVVNVFGDVLVPDVTTGAPSGVTTSSATLNGTVNPDGVALTDCHFDYGTDISYAGGSVPCLDSGGNSVASDSGSSVVAVHADVTGLQSGQTYHFRLVAANAQASNAGQDVAFGPPTLGSAFADAVGPTSVTLHAQVNPRGLDTTYHFEYGTTTGYGRSTPSADIGSGGSTVAVTQTAAGLQPNATYHFRLVASNGAGIADGPDGTFTTTPSALIDVQPPTGMSTSTGLANGTATLHAYVDPQGSDTSYHFDYGTDTSYGGSTPSQGAGAGGAPTLQSAQISGLSGGTTYHYRTVVTNPYGTYDGPDSTFTTPPANCPNQQFRTGLGALLPDCRAYEQVSPEDKGGYGAGGALIDAGGDRVGFESQGAFAGNSGGYLSAHYLARRTSAGWSTSAADPPTSVGVAADYYPSADLSASDAMVDFEPADFTVDSVKSGAFFMRKPDGSVVQASPTIARTDGSGLGSQTVNVASADLSHLFFVGGTEPQPPNPPQTGLLPGAPATAVYEVVGAGGPAPRLRVASVDLNGNPVDYRCNLGSQYGGLVAASSDGTELFFNGGPGCGQIWARVNGQSTVVVSDPSPNAECTTSACRSSAAAPATYLGGSSDGAKAFFTSPQQLTDSASEDSAPVLNANNLVDCVSSGGSGCNLYEYDFGRPAGHNLVTLSAGDVSGSGPRVQSVLGFSDDGLHVYFVAQGALTSEPNSLGQVARAGADNLYGVDTATGVVAFVSELCSGAGQSGSLTGVTQCPGSGNDLDLPTTSSGVTADGRFLVFTSYGQLTPDDTDAGSSAFEYDALTGSLVRLSVGHDGEDQNGNDGSDATAVGLQLGGSSEHLEQTGISADGQTVLFTTSAPLDVRDVNGATDVYEWHQGEVSLVSDGQSPNGLLDPPVLSASGQDIVFDTDTGLVPQDTDGLGDVYDARIGGGFPMPAMPPPGCSGDACQGQPASVPTLPSAASVGFSGPGDATSRSSRSPIGKATVVTRTVRGTRFAITVRVPAAGQITITGAGVRRTVAFVRHAGSYRMAVALTPGARSALRHRRRLGLALHVRYLPAGGSGSSANVPLMDRA
jgi:hypothetical protein